MFPEHDVARFAAFIFSPIERLKKDARNTLKIRQKKLRKPPPEHTRWKPGQSGNKSGKPKQLLTKDKVKGVLGKFSDMTRDQIQDVITNPKSTMLEIMVASIIVKAAKDGDFSRLNFILDRSIGRVAAEAGAEDQVDTSGMTLEEKIAWLKTRNQTAS